MKKLILSLLLALSLLLSLGVCAHAEAQLDYVTDAAGILTREEAQRLNDQAAELAARYDFGFYIVVVDDYRSYVAGGGIERFAEEVFAGYDLGTGESRNGVLLAMSMGERDYDIYAHGSFGNAAFTDYGKDQLAGQFLGSFRRNDWAGGFNAFLRGAGELVRRARDGSPVDIWIPDAQPEPPLTAAELMLSAVLACVISLITVSGFKRQMKTAVKQTRAGSYVAMGGVKLRDSRDEFVNRTVSRQVIRREPVSSRPSGGHYGGTTISGSHGGSHHSGKF